MNYLLTFDWDFFVRVLSAEWDWQHAESPMYREVVWPIRAASLMAFQGVSDPRELTATREEDPLDALDLAGIDLRGAPLTVSDSHALAMSALAPYTAEDGGMTVLNFDAHADVGYRAEVVREHGSLGVVACDDWLYWMLRGAPRLRAEIVYPSWKGRAEWDGLMGGGLPSWLSRRYTQRVGVSVWPDAARLEPGRVVAVHVCRSGSWSPPWHDAEFLAFVRRLEAATGSPALAPWEERERANVLRPRPFDLEQVRAESVLLRKAATGLMFPGATP